MMLAPSAGVAGAPVLDQESLVVLGVHIGGRWTGGRKDNFALQTAALLENEKFRAVWNGSATSGQPTLVPPATLSSDPLALASKKQITIPYDPLFLGVNIPVPSPSKDLNWANTPQKLDYIHYSLSFFGDEKIPRFAALNIDRQLYRGTKRSQSKWTLDPRRSVNYQLSNDFFANNRWDRGNLVSRRSVLWGLDDQVSAMAEKGTFYYTNATPQIESFNRGAWSKLENDVFFGLEPSSEQLSSFLGPVMSATPYQYNGEDIPYAYWMVAVFENPDASNFPIVHAFLVPHYEIDDSGAPVIEQTGEPNFFPFRRDVEIEEMEVEIEEN